MAEEITKINQDEQDEYPCMAELEVAKEERTDEGFIPTHDELISLAKYWFKDLLDSEWLFDFAHPMYGGSIWRERIFANRRINRIRKIVGDEKVDNACEEVRNDFRAKISEELWAVFEDGDEAQRAKVEEDAHAIVTGDKKLLASLTYLDFPESPSPDRTKRFVLRLTPNEMAALEAASRRLALSAADILREGATLYIPSSEKSKKGIDM